MRNVCVCLCSARECSVSACSSACFGACVAFVPFVDCGAHMLGCGAAPAASLYHDILKGETLVADQDEWGPTSLAILLGGVLSVLVAFIKEYTLFFGSCSLAVEADFGWSSLGVGSRVVCHALSIPQLAGFSFLLSNVSREYAYVVDVCDEYSRKGACVLQWAAQLLGRIHSLFRLIVRCLVNFLSC